MRLIKRITLRQSNKTEFENCREAFVAPGILCTSLYVHFLQLNY